MKAIRSTLGRFFRAVTGAPTPDSPTSSECLDIHDPVALNAILARHNLPLLVDDLTIAKQGVAEAGWALLGYLAYQPGARSRFSRPLSDPAFAEWFLSKDGPVTRLTPTALDHLRTAFASPPGEWVRRIYEFRPDMRVVFPFGMTPQQRGPYLDWLLTHGKSEMGVTPVQSLWFLMEEDESPDRGIARTYLLNAEWQAQVPHGLTIFGWPTLLEYLRIHQGLTGEWVASVRMPNHYSPIDQIRLLAIARPDRRPSIDRLLRGNDSEAMLRWLDRQTDLSPADADWREAFREEWRTGRNDQIGVNYFGHFRYPSGLQQTTQAAVESLHRVEVRTSCRDLMPEYPCDLNDRTSYDGVELFDVSVVCSAISVPPVQYLEKSGAWIRPGVHRAGVWYWECEDPPPDLAMRAEPFQEIWSPTRFLADSFGKVLSIPIVPILPGLELKPFTPRSRSHFGLRDDRFTFLVTFDMGSLMARKNPIAAVEAFGRAFSRNEPIDLVVKVSRGNQSPTDLAYLQSVCEQHGALLIDRMMPRDELLALMAVCDSYVSLHRAEGLGLGMAEAMLLGKPVIATRYSGNLDFMDDETGYLVDYVRSPIPTEIGIYPVGSHWAEASVEHAAEMMRRVVSDPTRARQIANQGRQRIQREMSLEAFGRRMRNRLEQIRSLRQAS